MHQAFRPIAMMLGIVLIIAVPAQAGPIRLLDVVQAISNNENARQTAQLQLRAISQQSDSTIVSGVRPFDAKSSTQKDSTNAPQGGSNQNVDTIELGDVTGTICDCGEIVLPGGGFGLPLWPLLGLAAVPLLFLNSSNSGEGNPPINVPSITPTPTVPTTPTPTVPTTPTPPPPPGTPIPEPATLLLFGSGMLAMGASTRRRRANRFAENLKSATEAGKEGE